MTDKENKLFQAEFLKKGLFPKLDSRGRRSCRKEIGTWGFRQFLDDGWNTLCDSDKILNKWLEKLMRVRTQDTPAIDSEKVRRSIRYGAALVYYPLHIQVEESKGEFIMPKTSEEQEASLRFDLSEVNSQTLGDFLVEFDEELAALLGGFLTNPMLLRYLSVDKDPAYLGMYFTYFVLASKAESLGMERIFSAE
ncbi:hypothetical protein A2Z22_04405 [Candidatus Woesebacteria bacterium RBG_16_34_12]|uniref:Uncharacterized protein n=1 Tax=Candidatus Woesebacteria bacterium RBG_16_34_12 TaxID=1802480 RepID=A0A1F7X9Y9_9BACT|nr:MAG: hypothetical protein A2Z22_04405 [Candidatus Woesebacteria bacterium RBG_16_34_12]